MALRTFTATRPPAASDAGLRQLASWHLSCGATTALVVNFCEETAAAPIFQVQLPINSSSSQAYPKPLKTPGGGRWHVEVVSGTFNRGAIEII